MTDKLELKSSHEVIDTVDVADVGSIFYCKPTDPDILTVVMKDGTRLYCDEVCPVDSLQEVPCNHCQGFNDKEKCDELVFGRKCPLEKGDNSKLTEFEKEVKGILFDAGDKYDLNTDLDKATKDLAPHFLEAARKQFVEEACEWLISNVTDYYYMGRAYQENHGSDFIDDFRKALEKRS